MSTYPLRLCLVPPGARTRALVLVCLLLPCLSSVAAVKDPRTLWRLLDYIAVDYVEAVEQGRVIDAAEYAEMKDFSLTVQEGLAALSPDAGALRSKADDLVDAVAARADPAQVADLARALARDLAQHHALDQAPSAVPDLARGQALYAEHCAACHGAEGRADGTLATSLVPPPVAFADPQRAMQRSVAALYEVISQGLEGTSMAAFDHLPEADRWALAYVAGQFAFDPQRDPAGAARLRDDAALAASLAGLRAQVGLRPAELAERIGPEPAVAVVGWLRRHPLSSARESTGADAPQALRVVRQNLEAAVNALARGEREQGHQHAVAAYLDGFEMIEPALAVRDAALMKRLENAMTALRAQLADPEASAAEVAASVDAIEADLDLAETLLSPDSPANGWLATFLGALTLLLREGMEALLVVVAMLAFLRKARRPEGQFYVYAGAVTALAAGALTWLAASHLISISGASRETTEGVAALSAAVILVFVGVWMHGRSQADAWQRQIHQHLGAMLTRRSLGLLFLLSFIVVYREVFETILFFIALLGQGDPLAAASGIASAALILAVLAWQMLRWSRRLPLGPFFSVSAVLIAALAVMLTGKGVAALQEAGRLAAGTIAMPQIELLGLYPTWQGITAQALCLLLLLAGFANNRRASSARGRGR